jgi:hypothetical protein
MPDSGKEKNWWVPLRRGLVADPTGKHYHRLGTAVWLHLYALVYADWRTGRVRLRLATVQRRTGFPRRTLQRWLPRLIRGGYLRALGGGKGPDFEITKWIALPGVAKMALGSRQKWRPGGANLAR